MPDMQILMDVKSLFNTGQTPDPCGVVLFAFYSYRKCLRLLPEYFLDIPEKTTQIRN